MKAIELTAPRHLTLAERADPQPGPGEVRIAVHDVGICGTDMDFYRGRRPTPYPFVLGHECSGRVDEVGAGVTGLQAGTSVTVRPNFGCGMCELCRAGRDNICPHSRGLGVTIDGCLAEYIIAPLAYVWPLPNGMDLEAGALIEPVAVAERAVRRAGDARGKRVCILGGGPIGLFALQIAESQGGEVTVVDPLPDRLGWAEDLGVEHVIDPSTDDVPSAVRALTGGQGFDIVIETAGVVETVPLAIDLLRPGGRVVLTGIPMDPAPLATRFVVWRELELVGSFTYTEEDFIHASDRIGNGEIKAVELITHRFALERASEAFDLVDRRAGLKVIIEVKKEVIP